MKWLDRNEIKQEKKQERGNYGANNTLRTLGSGKSIVWAILLIAFGFLAIALPFATSWGVVLVISLADRLQWRVPVHSCHPVQRHREHYLEAACSTPLSHRRTLFHHQSFTRNRRIHVYVGDLFCCRGLGGPGGLLPESQHDRVRLDSFRRNRHFDSWSDGLAAMAVEFTVGDRDVGGYQHDSDRHDAPHA